MDLGKPTFYKTNI